MTHIDHGWRHAPKALGGTDPVPGIGGIQFDTYPQAGDWLYVETTAYSPSTPNGFGIEFQDTGNGGMLFNSTDNGITVAGHLVELDNADATSSVRVESADFTGTNTVKITSPLVQLIADTDLYMQVDDTADLVKFVINSSTGAVEIRDQSNVLLYSFSESNGYLKPTGTLHVGSNAGASSVNIEPGQDINMTAGGNLTTDISTNINMSADGQIVVTATAGSVSVALGATGQTFKVKDHLGGTIFEVDENGDLHGKTGKALVFDR